MPSPYAEAVLELVRRIPPGRVLSYGDVAGLLEAGGPRQVGSVLATWGGGVPWWRVVRADGSPAPALRQRALPLLAAEGVPMRGERVDMGAARWQPETAALPGECGGAAC